jgi:hypothetical protein
VRELEVQITKVLSLNQRVQPAAAQKVMSGIIADSTPQQLIDADDLVQGALRTFLPKRRKALEAFLRQRREPCEEASIEAAAADPKPRPGSAPRLSFPSRESSHPGDYSHSRGLADLLVRDLSDLSQHHIFKWGTFYRDILSEHFNELLDACQSLGRPGNLLDMVKSALTEHSFEIFTKGFEYQTTRNAELSVESAVTKSLNGLQRLLDLPIEFYSIKLAEARNPKSGQQLRDVTSAMLAGIIRGYSRVLFDQDGSRVLAQSWKAWAHIVPFLNERDVSEIIAIIGSCPFSHSILDSVKPLIDAISTLISRPDNHVPLPALSQLNWAQRRLDVSIHLPPESGRAELLDVQCFLVESYVDRSVLEDASARGVTVVLCPLSSGIETYVASSERLSGLVVNTGSRRHGPDAQERVSALLSEAIYRRESEVSQARPLTFNFAKSFPLENPFLTKFVHVYRSSVRQLLKDFERRNGVRLWCSVRRSGKTTACSVDLDSTSSGSTVVVQTCDDTGQIPDGNTFYLAVSRALDEGKQLPQNFIRDTVISASAPSQHSLDCRYVFVLDEYETLFNRLRGALKRDQYLRYTVIQPLLNQLVSFTSENLIVLLGQQPTSHYLLMAQNQLSAYVEQDAFPLFAHDQTSLRSEFVELLRRVLSDRLTFDLGFSNAVFEETGGHPYLTVNILTEFVQWLIDSQRPLSALDLSAFDFQEFASSGLTLRGIRMSDTYTFFRRACVDASSETGQEQDPWLYAMYMALRDLGRTSPDTFSVTTDDFLAIAMNYEAHGHGLCAEDILLTGVKANFFEVRSGRVAPRIRTLAKIAASTRIGVSA